MKKIILLSTFLVFLFIAPHAFAQGFTALAPIPGLTDQSPTAVVNPATLAVFFNNLYKYMIGLAATLAVIMIIWGGLEISTKDSVSKQTDGKERIYNAIFGLILVLSPVLVFSIINPAILNLSLNLPPLDTAPGTVPMTTAQSLAPGSAQTCAAGSDLTNCVTSSQASCTSAGGTSQTRAGGAVGSETVTCVAQNQNVTTPGSTITANQCASLVGHSVAGSQGLQSTVLAASDAQDCNASNISELEAAFTLNYCANITGGGVCLYNQ